MPGQPTATAYWRILSPLVFPVRGEPGEYLAVLPGPENIRVIDRSAKVVIRRGSFPESKLWSALGGLEEAGLIQFLYGLPVHRLRRLSDHGELPRPRLRVVR